MNDLLQRVYEACKLELLKPKDMMRNCVRDIYKPFSTEEINQKVAEMLRPEGLKTPVELVFQSIDGLHEAIPNHHATGTSQASIPRPAEQSSATRRSSTTSTDRSRTPCPATYAAA